MRYSPTGSEGALKSPCSFVSTLRTRPVLMCVMVTEQFGRSPPVASETVPRRFPVATCDQPAAAQRTATRTRPDERSFITPPETERKIGSHSVVRLYKFMIPAVAG